MAVTNHRQRILDYLAGTGAEYSEHGDDAGYMIENFSLDMDQLHRFETWISSEGLGE